MTADEKRNRVRDKYREILGRNRYSQEKRDYCYHKASDGCYYSDCSSSISYAYKESGYSFGILNTVGMYKSKKLDKVDVPIKKGIPQDVSKLRIGDMLLFAGSDSSRAYADYVGHVEMVGEINGGVVTLYGHGSGTPSKKSMVAYCGQRQGARTSTKRGNKGLIKVVRYIQDDDDGNGDSIPVVTVKDVQSALLTQGYKLPVYGADGEYGPETASAIKAFQHDRGHDETGEINAALLDALGLVTAKVVVTGGSVNVRSAPSVEAGEIVGVVKQGRELAYQGIDNHGWHLIEYQGRNGWISGKWSEVK